MRAAATLVVAVAACGRVGFDSLAEDARPSDAPPSDAVDGPPVDMTTTDALDAPRDDSLALYMPFEGDTTFLSTNEYPTLCSGPCPTPTTGRVGQQAASFTGVGCVRIGAAALVPDKVTFAAWVRAPIAQTSSVFARAFEGATATTNSLEIYVENGTDWRVVVASQATGVSATLDAWHHVAATYDGADLTMYLDGLPQAVRQVNPPIPYTVEDLFVGCDFNAGAESDFFTGAIDDLRVYTRPLSPAEIAVLAE